MEVHWKNGETEWQTIKTKGINPDNLKFAYFWLKFSCKPDRKFWPLPDISMTDEEELDEEHSKTFIVPKDFIQYEKDELLEIRLEPLSLIRPLNLPALDCVKAYHKE